MSAAPAAALNEKAKPLNRVACDGGYTETPHRFIRLLPLVCPPGEIVILYLIWDLTAGAEGPRDAAGVIQRPRSVAISEKDLAARLRMDASGVRKAMASLAKKGLIEIDARGHGAGRGRGTNAYRVKNESITRGYISKMSHRSPRKMSKKVVGKQVETITVAPGRKKRIRFESPAPAFDLMNATADPLPVNAIPGSTPRIEIGKSGSAAAERPKQDVPDVQERRVSPAAAPSAEGPTRIGELSEMLRPIFLNLFAKVPDNELLRKIDAELRAASVAHYARIVHNRMRRNVRDVQEGLFVNMARDAAIAADAMESRAPDPLQPAPSNFVREDDSTASVWVQIRSDLARDLTNDVYSNFLLHTASGPCEGGKLIVRTIDDVTAQWCSEEYAASIERIVSARGFGLQVRFEAAST